MRLFVFGQKNEKIYLSINAQTRYECSKKINSNYFSVNGFYYNINNIHAVNEPAHEMFVGGFVLGFIGVLFHPFGFAVGFLIGAIIGYDKEIQNFNKCQNFNNTYVKL